MWYWIPRKSISAVASTDTENSQDLPRWIETQRPARTQKDSNLTFILTISASHLRSYDRARYHTQNTKKGWAARSAKEFIRTATPTRRIHPTRTHALILFALAGPAESALNIPRHEYVYDKYAWKEGRIYLSASHHRLLSQKADEAKKSSTRHPTHPSI